MHLKRACSRDAPGWQCSVEYVHTYRVQVEDQGKQEYGECHRKYQEIEHLADGDAQQRVMLD